MPDDRDEHDYKMRRPDFARVLDLHSRADQRDGSKHTEHGDPIRWGSTADVLIPAADQLIYTEQLIRVDRENAYPCNWQMIGTLAMPSDWFFSPASGFAWIAGLELLMGTGQTIVTHLVNLRALIDLAIPPALSATGDFYYFPNNSGSRIVAPWILPGGIVGKSIQVRAFFAVTAESPVTVPTTLTIAAEISPYNSGGGA